MTENLSIRELQGAEYNPRVISTEDFESLVRSIEEFGFVEPLVVRREDKLIIGGHQRLRAYREHLAKKGLSEEQIQEAEIPVVLLDNLSDDRAKLLNLALNRVHGAWDYDKLSGLLATLPESDLSLSGFQVKEIEDILAMPVMQQDMALPPMTDEELAEGLAAQARVFRFQVETDTDAELVAGVLKQFGMTGPGNAQEAFVAAMKAAALTKEGT